MDLQLWLYPDIGNDFEFVHFKPFRPSILCLLNRPLSIFLVVHFYCSIYSDCQLLVEWPSTSTHDHFGSKNVYGPNFGWTIHFWTDRSLLGGSTFTPLDLTQIIFQDEQFDEESVDMDEDEDMGFDDDEEDNMEDEWDPYDDEYQDEYDEEYDDEYYNEEDEWGADEEDNDDYSIDNLGDPSIDEQGSRDDIAEARNHYEAMVRSETVSEQFKLYS